MSAAQAQLQPVLDITMAVHRKLNSGLTDQVRNPSCLGNSDRELKDLVQDLLNERCSSDKDYEIVADHAFLMASTVRRVAHQDSEEDYQPRADTLSRLLRVLDCRLVAEYQQVQKKYLPNTKRPDLEDV